MSEDQPPTVTRKKKLLSLGNGYDAFYAFPVHPWNHTEQTQLINVDHVVYRPLSRFITSSNHGWVHVPTYPALALSRPLSLAMSADRPSGTLVA